MRQLSKAIEPYLVGLELATCFSQSKDELVLGFCDKAKEFWIRASLIPNFNLLTFPQDFKRSKRNSVELFKEALGLTVTGVTQYENERAFSIDLENGFQLVFKMFGNRSNIILTYNGQSAELFQKRHKDDVNLIVSELDREIDQSFDAFKEKGLRGTYPTLGKEALTYLKSKGFEEASAEKQWEMLSELISEISDPTYYLTDIDGSKQLLLFKEGDIIKKLDNPLLAANDFYYSFSREFFIYQEKGPVQKELSKRIEKAENYILKNMEKLEELMHGARYEEIANIIMANLHQIPARSKKVKLYDFYQDNEISIKLNELLTPQKNAENYYRKAKNQKIEIEKIQENIQLKEEELAQFRKHLQAIEPIEIVKELRKYLKANNLENIKAEQEIFPFRKFEFMNYEIWVGRNAVNNDLLTQRYAHKNDLWLHARDVSGSHVVIKYQAGRNFPVPVIEKAASLAAYYSQRKTDTLCPVIYTPKKFVRKRKGDPAGAVVVDKEQVIMIEPEMF
ncbi:NFACT RNA binding domain-containing protein [Limibacter armeniacum]|uniref:NFACT RNA binding domain-containing protein n=1 Tax=Limibacter armeniacum TaxID=466084 RepID=UPI002FE518D8